MHPVASYEPPENRILIVDDEPEIRELLAKILSTHGYKAEVAGDVGGEAEAEAVVDEAGDVGGDFGVAAVGDIGDSDYEGLQADGGEASDDSR